MFKKTAFKTITLLPFALMSAGATMAATDEEPLDADIFIELNATDGDLSLQASVDAVPYRKLEIKGADDLKLLTLQARGRLSRHGLGELELESDGPDGDRPATFFRRFPEGAYDVDITTLAGEELESTTLLTHVLPAPVGDLKASGKKVGSCDGRLPTAAQPVVVTWDAVAGSHPAIGATGAVNVVEYALSVEDEDAETGGEFHVDLPASVTQFQIPEEFTGLGHRFKVEIAAVADTENTTVVEGCFKVGS